MARIKDEDLQLVNQPSAKPTRKIAAGAGAGFPLAILIGWGAGELGIDLPEEVTLAIAALLGSLGSAIVGYFTHELDTPRNAGT